MSEYKQRDLLNIEPDVLWYTIEEPESDVFVIRKNNKTKDVMCSTNNKEDVHRLIAALNMWTGDYTVRKQGHITQQSMEEQYMLLLKDNKEMKDKVQDMRNANTRLRLELDNCLQNCIEYPPWYLRMAIWIYEKLNN